MLRRTALSPWFDGGSIIDLTKHTSEELIVEFPREHRKALDRLEQMAHNREVEKAVKYEK